MKDEMKNYTFKMVVIGYYSVGKSSVVSKYVRGEFNPNEESTIGASFLTKTLFMKDYSVKFEIWDTAGQERYNSLVPMYYRGAQVALIVYDITSLESFETAKRWLEELKFEKPKEFMKVLIGNKMDLEEDRKVEYQDGKALADSYGINFFETSAKTGYNLPEVFNYVAEEVPKEKANKKKKSFKIKDDYMKYLCC